MMRYSAYWGSPYLKEIHEDELLLLAMYQEQKTMVRWGGKMNLQITTNRQPQKKGFLTAGR